MRKTTIFKLTTAGAVALATGGGIVAGSPMLPEPWAVASLGPVEVFNLGLNAVSAFFTFASFVIAYIALSCRDNR